MARPKTPTRRSPKTAVSLDRPDSVTSSRTARSVVGTTAKASTTTDGELPADEVSAPEKARLSRPAPIFFGWLVLPFIVTFAHIVLSPYTKVEETPGLHAVHDILKYGAHPRSIAKYEHVVYPGAVPRSVIPSLAIAAVCKPLLIALRSLVFITTGLEAQIITRLVLAAVFSHSLGHLAQTINLTSATAAKAFLLLSLSQFHVPYYAGRFLPNFLALPLVVISFSTILRYTSGPRTAATKEYLSKALITLAFTAVVIRLELAPMVAAVAGTLWVRGDLALVDIVIAGAMGGCGGLAATAIVDGYFYRLTEHQYPFWPELSAFMFNIPQGRAAEWGIMPPWHYLIALPKLLLASLPLAAAYPVLKPSSPASDRLVQLLLVPSAALIAALSLVGHKEWRFIAYVVPLLNVLAAYAAASLWDNPSKTHRAARKLGLLGAVLANLVITALLTYISTQNYPGGEVGLVLQRLAAGEAGKVWVPAAALHTGATVYTLPPATLGAVGAVAIGKASAIAPAANLTIVRPESSYAASRDPQGNSPTELYAAGYDWVVTDDWALFEGDVESGKTGWEVAGEVKGYRGVRVEKEWPFVFVDMGRRLAVMRRV